jgi:hypothetical protein
MTSEKPEHNICVNWLLLGEEDMAKVSQGIQNSHVFWKIGSHMNDKMVQNEIWRKTIDHI